MITKNPISMIEAYAQEKMRQSSIAHDYEHVNRVRHWAVQIAEAEGYPHLDRVQATALLHDVGLVHGRAGHAQRGAKMAAEFLSQQHLFPEKIISEIASAIASHNSLQAGGPLAHILRDADILDLLGPMGIMRGCTSMAHKVEFPPDNPKGENWGITAVEMTARFQSGQGVGATIIDQINFQISCFENLHTASAQEWGRPLQAFMKTFICSLENQIFMELTS